MMEDMDAAERREHERVQAELVARWAVWDRKMKWGIRARIVWLAVLLAVAGFGLSWPFWH